MAKVELLNNHRETLKAFIRQAHSDRRGHQDTPQQQPANGDRGTEGNREQLRAVFDIIRHAYEFDSRHPEQIAEHRMPGMFGAYPVYQRTINPFGLGTPGRGFEMGSFSLGGAGGADGTDDSNARQMLLRQLLQQMGAPSSFWDNIAVPMESTTLDKIPSQSYENASKERSGSNQCNQECNICLTPFEPPDMVRIFPCCQLVSAFGSSTQ